MGSLGSSRTWAPYTASKDCSQGFCSLYCPQWCYIIFPPPPPIEFPDDNSTPTFSPLVIAIIGILVSAFLLVSYYTIISKYCGNVDRAIRSVPEPNNQELEDDHNPSLHEPWHIETTGLDEALIKSIAAFKYKRGDGLVEGTDCSVCLSEFKEDETIRLLPKCSHAFHLPCIDTWLRSHPNCPLCRANIVSFNASTLSLPPPGQNHPSTNESLVGDQSRREDENVVLAQDQERCVDHGVSEEMDDHVVPKNSLRAFSDLGNSEERDIIIEIRDHERTHQPIRRSVSMDHSSQNHVLVAEILRKNNEYEQEDIGYHEDQDSASDRAGSSKLQLGENSKSSRKKRVLHCVMSPVLMKRSFSSGRFYLARPVRGHVHHPSNLV